VGLADLGQNLLPVSDHEEIHDVSRGSGLNAQGPPAAIMDGSLPVSAFKLNAGELQHIYDIAEGKLILQRKSENIKIFYR
jgi:hypothetical protein